MSNRPTFAGVDEYLAQFTGETHERLEQIRKLIFKHAPDATERISYGIPAAFLGKHVIVYFSGYEHHVAIYPGRALTDLDDELKPYMSGKSTLKFMHDKPLPLEIIERYIIVRTDKARQGE